jgi:hypothetical protein
MKKSFAHRWQRLKNANGDTRKMRTRIYDECGINRAEMNCIRQIEKSKLMGLLERERALTSFLAEHYSCIILKNPNKPIETADALLAHIGNHPEVKEAEERIDNILDAFGEFKGFSDGIRARTRNAAFEKLETVIRLVHRAV